MAPRFRPDDADDADVLNVQNVRAALVELLGVAWAYEDSAGSVADDKADRLLEDLIWVMRLYWKRYTGRRRVAPISARLVEEVAATYAEVDDATEPTTLEIALWIVFELEGVTISDEELDRLLVTRQQIKEREGDSTSGPKETARSRLGDVFGDVSANTVKQLALKQKLSDPFPSYAYGRGPHPLGLAKYARALLAEEDAKNSRS